MLLSQRELDVKEHRKTEYRAGLRIFKYLFRPKSGYMSGYTKGSRFLITLMNYVLSLVFIVIGSPLLFAIGLTIKLMDPGPVFYKGKRLGMNKKIFIMYKFRTLPVGAQRKIGSRLLSPLDYRLPFFSKFLRDTRLDELPQLFNIIKGDMDFIGPRPLRPEIYDEMCRNIPGFDRRFAIRPGLIGYSQLFTPHSSPKKIRALIDNQSLYLKRSFLIDLFFIVITIFIVLKKIIVLLSKAFWKYVIRIKVLKEFNEEKRVLDRVKIDDSTVSVLALSGKEVCEGVLKDMNETHFKFVSNKKLDLENQPENNQYLFKLKRQIKRMGKRKVKTGKCLGEVFKSWEVNENGYKKYIYVIKYNPVNQFNQYIIDQYFLDKSVMHYF